MKLLFSTALLLLCLAPAARAQDENPFKKAVVGDWVKYNVSATTMNITLTGEMIVTVIAKTETEATVRTVIEINKQAISSQDTKIDLSKPFDPTSTTGLPAAAAAKPEKVEEKKDKIKVAGKEHDCTMTQVKLNAKVMGQEYESDIKMWMSKDVPFTNLAKMELKSRLTDFTMEFTSSGNTPPAAKKK